MKEPGNLSNLNHRELRSRTGEAFSHSAVLSELLGFQNLFIHHELLPPGRRASSPHRHPEQEEMILILKGQAIAHRGETTFELKPGDFLGFKPGTDELHFVENQSQAPCEFLVIASKPDHPVYE